MANQGRLLTLLLMVSTPSSYLVPRQNSTSQPASLANDVWTPSEIFMFLLSRLILSCLFLVFFLSFSCPTSCLALSRSILISPKTSTQNTGQISRPL